MSRATEVGPGASAPVTDLLDPRMFSDPFDVYADLRRNHPVAPVRAPLVREGGYMVTRYRDVLTVHTDPRFSTDMITHGPARLVRFAPRLFRVLIDSMVFKDDPEHLRLRGLVNKAFTPKRVRAMTDDIARIADGLVVGMAGADEPVDLVEALATPLPLSVIASMLGVGPGDRDRFHADVRSMLSRFSTGPVGAVQAMPPSRRLLRLFDRLAAERRAEPDDGLITALVQAEEDDDALGDDEVISMMFLLLLAGHDTTSNLIASGVLALLDHPEQLQRLRDDPTLIDRAVEELLRFTSPVPFGTTRYVLDDVELSGVVLPRGSEVIGMIISANRDETEFDHPEELDLGRDPNRHLAFAFGSHFCLGNQLARLEARAAIGALVRTFDRIELAVPRDRIRYKPTPSLRGPVSVPLRLT
jgi:cytochrome P450